MRFAIIENQEVVNTIVAEQDFIDQHFPGAVDITNNLAVSISWKYVDGQFIDTSLSTSEQESTND
jgi:hypothetical protein